MGSRRSILDPMTHMPLHETAAWDAPRRYGASPLIGDQMISPLPQPYPTVGQLAKASPVELWSWYLRLNAPRNRHEHAVLLEIARRLEFPVD
jgi:hypothetical protein